VRSESRVTLADLAVGDRARVTAYQTETSDYAHQLTRLGLIPGTEFAVIRKAPLGDPIEIRFRGFSLAVRPQEAFCLELEPLSP